MCCYTSGLLSFILLDRYFLFVFVVLVVKYFYIAYVLYIFFSCGIVLCFGVKAVGVGKSDGCGFAFSLSCSFANERILFIYFSHQMLSHTVHFINASHSICASFSNIWETHRSVKNTKNTSVFLSLLTIVFERKKKIG